MTQINLYFTTLLIFLTLTGKISYSTDNTPQLKSTLILTQSRHNPDFTIEGNPDQTQGIANRYRYNFDGDGRPEPGRRKGGASRGNCPPIQPALTALIPKTNLGLTTKEYPTLWFYVPYSATDIPKAELMVLDENQRPILEKPMVVQLSKTPGIMGVTLPSTAKPLEFEQKYRWYFELVCDTENPSNNPTVDGWIKRVQLSQELMTQLDNHNTQQHYLMYAENGIWYDALTHLIPMIGVNPSDPTLTQNWSDLLEAVGLQELVDTSITDCCSSN
jgi:hypothetical protein